MQQGVVEWFATIFCRLNEDLKIIHYLTLSTEIAEVQWAQGILKVLLRRAEMLFFAYVEIVVGHYFRSEGGKRVEGRR